jgi:hypothetical protein
MSSSLTRRSLIENSLAASLGTLWTGPPPASPNRWIAPDQVPADSFSVKEFGAKGDGSTDDARAFQAAIAAASRVNGVVAVPASAAKYVIGSSITLAPNVRIQGAGGSGPTLRLSGAAEAMFNFVGISEAEGLNASLTHLTLESGSAGDGVAVRVRNFSGLFLRHVSINHFNLGLWADWGIGVHLYACSLVRNTRAVQVGGAGRPGGIRGPGRQADPFLDTVVIDACAFAQNGLDINDMGSNRSLGGTVIRDSSFFEAYTNPVPGKSLYIRLANRKAFTLCGNWFEGGQRSRTFIYLGNYDHDRNLTGSCYGGAIFGNDFLQTGQTGTVGVDVASCEAATVFGNCFEFVAGNGPIRLADSVGRSTVGQNSYVTYPDRLEYANPIGGSPAKHQLLDPRFPARLANELQVAGRVASAITTPAYGARISTDAAAGNYFAIAVTDGKPFTIQDPAKPIPGQQIVYDIRNNSVGAMGDITWGAAFQLAGPFIKPASERRRTISFYCDGAAWIEIARATADI